MKSIQPHVSVALLVAAAILVFAGGNRLARREQRVRVRQDREAVRSGADRAQAELERLERLYESHLCRVARKAPQISSIMIRPASDWLVALEQVSILGGYGKTRKKDLHVQLDQQDRRRLPAPLLHASDTITAQERFIVLPPEVLNAEQHDWGWTDEPGKPLAFWYCTRPRQTDAGKVDSDPEIVVLLVNAALAGEAMNEWLATSLENNPLSPGARGSGERLSGPGGRILQARGAGEGDASAPPDLLLPMKTRFGTWQVMAWDGWETQSYTHIPTLAAASALSILLVLLGIGVHIQQKRAMLQAEQRVSFINRVSHELRVPLTNILLNTDMVSDALNDGNSRARDRLTLVQEEGRRLGRLIDNVLTFSRREQGRLVIKPRLVTPADVVESVLQQFESALKRRSIDVFVHGSAGDPCMLDPDVLVQILTNLVSNVEKYASEGGVLEITQQQENGTFTLRVADRGPGVPRRDAERIFDPFQRVHHEVTEGTTGTGLGLPIARDLAVRVGGTLDLLDSEEGAVFELRIPVTQGTAPDNGAVS